MVIDKYTSGVIERKGGTVREGEEEEAKGESIFTSSLHEQATHGTAQPVCITSDGRVAPSGHHHQHG